MTEEIIKEAQGLSDENLALARRVTGWPIGASTPISMPKSVLNRLLDAARDEGRPNPKDSGGLGEGVKRALKEAASWLCKMSNEADAVALEILAEEMDQAAAWIVSNINAPQAPCLASREEVARIVDPGGWDSFDRQSEIAGRIYSTDERSLSAAREMSAMYVNESLEAADRIILALRPHLSVGGGVGIGNPITEQNQGLIASGVPALSAADHDGIEGSAS